MATDAPSLASTPPAPPVLGFRSFASASAIDFSRPGGHAYAAPAPPVGAAADTVDALEAAPSEGTYSTFEDLVALVKKRKGGGKGKHRSASKKKRSSSGKSSAARAARGASSDAHDSSSSDDDARGVPGLYAVDTLPDISSLSYGTVLDAPLYRRGTPNRFTLGIFRLTSMERQWLSHGSGYRGPPGVEVQYQIEGADPRLQRRDKWHLHADRYFAPGAVPPRPRLHIAASSVRAGLQKQAVMTAVVAQQKESEWAAAQRRAEEVAKHLQVSLGTKVVSFGSSAPSGNTLPGSHCSSAAGVVFRASELERDTGGFIPMDPVGLDTLAEQARAADGGAGADADSADAVRREQLALQSHGLLVPAWGESVADFVQRRSKELNEAVRDRPEDEAVWLDLAAFQSVCIDSSLSSTGRLRRRDAAVLDKQVAIYERGMSACPASVALAQACVRACEEGCTREQVDAMWRRCLEALPGEAVLWTEYLLHVASAYTTFTMPALRSASVGALASIRSVHNSEAAADRAKGVYVFEAGLHSAHHARRSAALAVLALSCGVEASSGSSELRVALWQAALEFNLNVPAAVSSKPLATRLQFFEAFWDSDHARIGDVASDGSGWSAWLSAKMGGDEPECEPSTWDVTALGEKAGVQSEALVWGLLGRDETAGVGEPAFEANSGTGGSLGAGVSTGSGTRASSGAAASQGTKGTTNDSDIVMVYSALHGYRIPVRVEAAAGLETGAGAGAVAGAESSEVAAAEVMTSQSQVYLRILGELREENGSDVIAAERAARVAAHTLAPTLVLPSNPFKQWLDHEDQQCSAEQLPARAVPGRPVAEQRVVSFSSISGFVFDAGSDLHFSLIVRMLDSMGLHIAGFGSSNSITRIATACAAEQPSDLLFDDAPAPLTAQPFLCHPQPHAHPVTRSLPFPLRVPAACACPTLSAVVVQPQLFASHAACTFVRNTLHRLLALGVLDRSVTLLAAVIEFEGMYAVVEAQRLTQVHAANLVNSTEPVAANVLSRTIEAGYNAAMSCTTESARGVVRGLLSGPGRSNQLRLWQAFGAFEVGLGNVREGVRVLDKAASLGATLSSVHSRHQFGLWAGLALLACPIGGSASASPDEAVHALCACAEGLPPSVHVPLAGVPAPAPAPTYVPFARALKRCEGDASKLNTRTRVLKARTAFQQAWARDSTSLASLLRGVVATWLNACGTDRKPGKSLPELVFPSLITSTSAAIATGAATTASASGVDADTTAHQLADLSSHWESRLLPLSPLALCVCLFLYHTSGYSAAAAAFSRAVRLVRGAAAAVAAAARCAVRGDAIEVALREYDAVCAAYAQDSSDVWCGPLAAVGSHSSATTASITVPVAGIPAESSHPTPSTAPVPVDTGSSVGALIDTLLVNCEWLYVWWAGVSRAHAHTHTLAPRVTRTLLESGLAVFPGNALMLHWYACPERSPLASAVRVRQFLDRFMCASPLSTSVTSTASPVFFHPAVWVCVLVAELRRACRSQSEDSSSFESGSELVSVPRVRRLFEQAVAAGAGASVVLLWRMYLRFELVCGNALGAKQVLLRGVHACPWSKSLWCDSVRRLLPYLTHEETMGLLRAMVQKGVRMRVGVSRFVAAAADST